MGRRSSPDSGADGAAAPAGGAPGPAAEHWRVASLARQNLARLGMPRVNVLFIGADAVLSRYLTTALELAAPLAAWRPGEPMQLPERGVVRTLFIRDADAMSGAEQVRLLEWLNGAVGRTQVVCTSSAPLLPLVEDGRFLDTLYYRLNTVCVDLSGER